uniref:Uncharacterized protein n=1 Tax=Anopheles albimanus TaxID=7167 RepID=A0A182FZH0_ANOAL
MTDNSCRMVRYATPPNETPAERAKRLTRKRQAAYRIRQIARESNKIEVVDVANLPLPPTDRMARYSSPPGETAQERAKRLRRKRQAAYRMRRAAATDPLKVGVMRDPNLPSFSLDENALTADRMARYVTSRGSEWSGPTIIING